MKISFDKKKIETVCIVLTFLLIVTITILCILAAADGIFNWDIFTEFMGNVGILVMSAMGMIIAACFVIHIMVTLSMISSNIERIADKIEQQGDRNGGQQN